MKNRKNINSSFEESPYLKQRTSPALFFLIVGILFLFNGITDTMDQLIMIRSGVKVDGTVIGFHEEHIKSGRYNLPIVKLVSKEKDLKEVILEERSAYLEASLYKLGDEVHLIYNKNDINSLRPFNGNRDWLAPIGEMVFGFSLCLGVLFILRRTASK